jgi:hypothetical protein
VNPSLVRTGRWIVAGTWGCAIIVMAASAANAALTYGALGDNRILGLATGVAVDIGLCVALIGTGGCIRMGSPRRRVGCCVSPRQPCR